MTGVDFERAILTRLAHAHANVDAATVSALARYLVILQHWNRRINLTAFDLDRATDHAIDRLIVEPVVTANELADSDHVVIDVGSGGGSPALPLKVVRPQLAMTLVEARVRKSAFLREAARELNLGDVRVETLRLERAGLADRNGTADVVTMRAVRADADVLEGVRQLLAPAGRLFWFHDPAGASVAGISSWSGLRANPRTLPFLRVLRPV